MKPIDFRSDTVTHPTKEMYEAMVLAEVGDDVAGDDPTANRLEELAADMLGKEAALYVVSGTMGNICAAMTYELRGKEAVLGAGSHMFNMEAGGISTLAGATARTLPFPDEVPDAQMIEAAIRPRNIHHADAALICLENALSNGRVVDKQTMAEIYRVAQAHGIPVHVDGARIFNAAVSLGVDVKELTRYCDTISCCLSKGLCSPIGAVLAGSRDFVERARKYRKMLGGGMRQCGVTAAAGIVSLEKMTGRLAEDHENARYLARRLSALDGVSSDPGAVAINMVFAFFDKPGPWKEALPERLLAQGYKIYPETARGFRFMTHNDVTRADIDAFVDTLAGLVRQ